MLPGGKGRSVSQRSTGVLDISVGPPTRHAEPMLQIGNRGRVPHDIVVARSVRGGEGLDPLDVEMLTSRFEKHQMFVSFVYRDAGRIIQAGNDDRSLLENCSSPHIQNVQGGCDKKSGETELLSIHPLFVQMEQCLGGLSHIDRLPHPFVGQLQPSHLATNLGQDLDPTESGAVSLGVPCQPFALGTASDRDGSCGSSSET